MKSLRAFAAAQLSVALVFGTVPFVPQPVFAEEDEHVVLSYLDEYNEPASVETTSVVASTKELKDGWYAANVATKLDEELVIRGDAKLILPSNTVLVAPRGIKVAENASLTLYPADGEDTPSGTLLVLGGIAPTAEARTAFEVQQAALRAQQLAEQAEAEREAGQQAQNEPVPESGENALDSEYREDDAQGLPVQSETPEPAAQTAPQASSPSDTLTVCTVHERLEVVAAEREPLVAEDEDPVRGNTVDAQELAKPYLRIGTRMTFEEANAAIEAQAAMEASESGDAGQEGESETAAADDTQKNEGENVTITFDPNGGTGAMDPMQVPANESFQLPECAFEPPAGQVFDSWSLGAPGTNVSVPSSTTVVAWWKDAPANPSEGAEQTPENPTDSSDTTDDANQDGNDNSASDTQDGNASASGGSPSGTTTRPSTLTRATGTATSTSAETTPSMGDAAAARVHTISACAMSGIAALVCGVMARKRRATFAFATRTGGMTKLPTHTSCARPKHLKQK